MIDFRWKVEKWQEWDESACCYFMKESEPVLQVRMRIINPVDIGFPTGKWTEWRDVPVEVVEV